MQPASAATPGRDRPRFRQDLFAELVEDHGARFIDVMAPEGGDAFRLYEVEYSLACGMDGERDVAGIVKWAQDELGLTPSQHEVRTIIATLGELGFMDPGARAEAPELASGVVPAQPDRGPASPAVELGAAGGAARRGAAPATVPDLALGTPGSARGVRPTPPSGAQTDVTLGAAGARAARRNPTPAPVSSDVSVDLADHIDVRPDDVKEAVRASKVMSVVDVPPEMLEDRGTSPGSSFDGPTEVVRPNDPPRPPAIVRPGDARPVDARAAEPSRIEPPRGPEPLRAAEPPRIEPPRGPEPGWPEVDARPTGTQTDSRIGKSPPARAPVASRPPVELPPAPTGQPVPPPPTPRGGPSPALIVGAILAVVAAGGFALWKFVLDKPDVDAETSAPPPPPVKPAPPPPPPPPPTAKIALETPEPVEIKTMRTTSVIETVQTDKAAVKEGDVVVRVVGDKPLEAERAALERDRKRLNDLIEAASKRRDAAQAAGNKTAETSANNEINDRQKSLANKENQLAAKTAELGAFLLRAPVTGTFLPAVKLGQKIPSGGVVGRVQHDPIPVATFKATNTRPFAANASVEVAVGSGEQRVTCTVADVQGDDIKVVCPTDPALTEGVDVTLQVPAAAAQAMPEGAPAAPAAAPGDPGVVPTAPAPSAPSGAGEPSGAAAPGAPPSPGSAAP